MTIEQLQRVHSVRPFQPFDIYLADGRVLPVEHPEFLMRSQSGRRIGVARPDDTIETVDLLLAVSSPGPTDPRNRVNIQSDWIS
jgi:hypothetical protein